MALTIHTVQVPRKGKAAKGTVTIKTIAVPVLVNGVAVRFTFDHLASVSFKEVVDSMEQVFNFNQSMMKESFVRGGLEVERSAVIKENIEVKEVASFLFDNDYAETEDRAITLATAFHTSNEGQKAIGFPAETLDSFCNRLSVHINKLKADGLWKASLKSAGEVIQPVVVNTPAEVIPAVVSLPDTGVVNQTIADAIGNR